ncbi:MAG: ABC transporter permease [Akkermansiaceae bacterium]|nr:ABC transporter permease [Armatimonadota bacterium]
MNLQRLWVLVLKEIRQIRRNRSLIVSLIVPPTLQILMFGFALNPTVSRLRLGVVDASRTRESRDLVAAFTANGTFVRRGDYASVREMESGLSAGRLDAGLVIPPDFARDRLRSRDASSGSFAAPTQLFIDATNANTAGIAQGYAAGILNAYNGGNGGTRSALRTNIALLYNPGLVSSWFVVAGTIGILIVLNGSLVAAATTIKEKEEGTIEQLLMTPADTGEIIAAKMTPLFVLLFLDVVLALAVAHTAFALPVRGNLGIFLLAGALCALTGIGIGTFIATFTKTGLQAQLLTFFVNPPLALLSGATTPIEAMPPWLQPWTLLNPVRHFATISRTVLIKGGGFTAVWENFLALSVFAFVLLFLSIRRFRDQLE